MKNIKNYNDPFILWAGPRTASTALFYSYAENNNCPILEANHEPINKKNPNPKEIDILINQGLSFKCMMYGYFHYAQKRVLKKLISDIPNLDYRHIVLYRKNLLDRFKSNVFSIANDVWTLEHVNKKTYEGWTKKYKEEINKKLECCLREETQLLDNSLEIIKILNEHSIPYQKIEFEEACNYIGKDTSQNTSHYYDEFEIPDETKKLLKGLEDHEFYRM